MALDGPKLASIQAKAHAQKLRYFLHFHQINLLNLMTQKGFNWQEVVLDLLLSQVFGQVPQAESWKGWQLAEF